MKASMTDHLPEPMELPRPNLPLLRKVLDHIDTHPEEWRQGVWATVTSCGTVACIAGHAVAMTEGLIRHPDGDGFYIPASGRDWITAGRDALGLTQSEAGEGWSNSNGLFCSDNDRSDVQRIAEGIADRAGERL